MSAHRWHHVDESERRRWQDPEAILKGIGLKTGFTFVDVGCGEGFFTLPAARMTGTSGKVYGLDIDETAINELRHKASAAGLNNLKLQAGPAEKSIFCRGCADIVFFGIVLHDFEEPAAVLANARKMLKPDGRLVDLDWKKEDSSFGPPMAKRFDDAFASKLIESAGFKIEGLKPSGQYHYLIIARPD